MGNDGGSIPTRRELVKEAARNPTATEVKESLHEQQDYLWNTDPLSQRPLARPVVSDHLGRLFNKDSVIEFLLPAEDSGANKRAEQEAFVRGAIKTLRDTVEVQFQVQTTAKGSSSEEKWICPVTRQELGPGSKAVYLVPCGHAFSGAAVKEVSEDACLQCNEPYAPNDLIPILPTSDTDISRLTLRAQSLKERGLTHSLKKVSGGGKKRKKQGATTDATNGSSKVVDVAGAAEADVEENTAPSSKPATPDPTVKSSNVIKNAATASLTAKVLEEQEERNKRRKVDQNKNLDSLFSHAKGTSQAKQARDTGFMTRGYAVPGQR